MPIALSRRLALAAGLAAVLMAGRADAATYSRHQPASPEWVKSLVVAEASRLGVPADLALAVARVESNFQSNALSPKGARGVMQIMPATAWGWYGVAADDLWDPQTNIQTGIRHLYDLYLQFGSWDLALVGYYAGPGVARRGWERASADVRGYVASVNGYRGQFQDYGAPAEPPTRVAAIEPPPPPSRPARAQPARPVDEEFLAGPAYVSGTDAARVERVWQSLRQW